MQTCNLQLTYNYSTPFSLILSQKKKLERPMSKHFSNYLNIPVIELNQMSDIVTQDIDDSNKFFID